MWLNIKYTNMTSSSLHLALVVVTSLLCGVTCARYLHVVSDICISPTSSVLGVIIVCSAVDHVTERDVIRDTWASTDRLRVVFMLGSLPISDAVVCDEALRQNDIIQADFVDSYANLSRKSVEALKWAATYAACARFIAKADDDTFINTPLLSRDLDSTNHRRFIMGHVIARAHPVRTPGAKWFTPRSLYADDAYPTYASGAAYVISGDSVTSLVQAAMSVPTFWLEDIYVTGMLSLASGVQLIVNGKWDGYRSLDTDCAVQSHIVLHRVHADDMRRLWRVVTGDDRCRLAR